MTATRRPPPHDRSAPGLELTPKERLLYASRIAPKCSLSPSGCLEWIGAVSVSKGGVVRPLLQVAGKRMYAHRVVAACVAGVLPKGAAVCHKCDNPMCVHPAHLVVADQAWNMHDMARKGRSRAGKPRFDRKVSPEGLEEILRMAADGHLQREIASRFGISQSAVSQWLSRCMREAAG